MPATVNVQDVQSLAFSGHLGLPHAIATRLTVTDAPTARTALRALVQARVNFGVPPADRKSAVQLLLSAEGLLALKAPGKQVAALARPFWQGLVMPHRSRALGDSGRNAPSRWLWCERGSHAWLLIYADTESEAMMVCDTCVEQLQPSWVEQDGRIPLRAPGDAREPFRFLDGVGRMRVDIGDGRPAEPNAEVIPAGELILGYQNALGTKTVIPPLGRSGSYVVIRQLEQDVESFWSFWKQQGGDNETAVWPASKAVGRWPNGMPVSGEAPRPEPPYVEADVRGRLSFRNDTEGDRCPLGAHIRRANPRDGLSGDPERSLTIAGQHRLLRRGRVYGTPAPADWMPSFRPEPYARENGAGDATEGRGLFFAALCGDIARQFEFTQQTWLNNPKFAGVYDEVDAIAAGYGLDGDHQHLSIPRPPLRRRVRGVRRWVTVRGGGYYLMPGRQALLDVVAPSTNTAD